MPITAPYFSICRPYVGGDFYRKDSYYIDDPRYSPARSQLIHAYALLERELRRVFDYVEPADGNLRTFSHETYQLLLRACTEVETSATGILTINGYRSPRRNWNVEDYYKLESACRLSQYQVRIPVWRGSQQVLTPFAAWNATHTLNWYRDYNDVKHDRTTQFEKASLENLLNAVSGVFVILFAQFYINAFGRYRSVSMCQVNDGWLSVPDALFDIRLPSNWTDQDAYDFDWKAIEKSRQPFVTFPF